MTVELANPITGYALTFMPGSPGSPEKFGWIELINGNESAGFIYLSNEPVKPHLSFKKTYIVTSVPTADLSTMLDILRHETGLQIRFFDPEAAGVEPTVFIESAERPTGSVSAEILAEARTLLGAPMAAK